MTEVPALQTSSSGQEELHNNLLPSRPQTTVSQRDNNADKSSPRSTKVSIGTGTDTTTNQHNYCSTTLGNNNTSLHIHYMKMVSLFKEFLLLILVSIIYTALTYDFNQPKLEKAPDPVPFFGKDSIVLDLYKGDISKAISRAGQSDIVFLMVYAPWDAESQEIRADFERAAEILKGVVTFAAVNCWQPHSECRQKSNKIYNWPVLLAYTSQAKVIQYNGPKQALHLVKFLMNVMHPFKRIQKLEEVDNLLVEHDVVILASVDCNPGSRPFATVYNIALKALERDPLAESQVAIICQDFSVQNKPQLRLYLWNETLIYPEDMNFKTKELMTWISGRIHQVTLWVTPRGTKSTQLGSYMQGPTLFLFTPLNPLGNAMDYYISLKSIAMDYYNCNEDLHLTSRKLSLKKRRLQLRQTQEKLAKQCKPAENIPVETSSVTFSPSLLAQWNNTTCPVGFKSFSCALSENMHFLPKPYFPKQPKDIDDCLALKAKSRNIYLEDDEKEISDYKTSQISNRNDKYSSENLKRKYFQQQCQMAELNAQFPTAYSQQDDTYSIRGLSCRTPNASLTLLAMDSLIFHNFAERFDLDVLNSANQTALLLVDDKEESHYVLDEPYLTDLMIKQFIANYTAGNLSRAFLSGRNATRYEHTHFSDCKEKSDISIRELYSENFLATVLQPHKMVLVMYHSKQCAFCSATSHILLQTWALLGNLSDYVTFARIDVDSNTLPWEYTMETLPTIILFPPTRKSESRIFPRHLPITVDNLIGFLLANADAAVRLQLMWTLCQQTDHFEEFNECITTMRIENLFLIQDTLKEWRMADVRNRPVILHKLQKLKNIHTRLAVKFDGGKNSERALQTDLNRFGKFSARADAFMQAINNQLAHWKQDL